MEGNNFKYSKSGLTQNAAISFLKKLNKIMKKEKPYLDFRFSLSKLADRLNVSRNILSQLLNEYKNINFYHFVSSFRIEEVKRLLLRETDQSNFNKIASAVGFSSRSSFYSTFKKSTGLTPGEFQKKGMHNTKKTPP